ncbi:MAG: virulence factor BrkB family protein [Thermodesulfovibrionales bacterium]
MRFVRVIPRSIAGFFRDDGLMLAGSMSYFTMMALVPFCLFVISVIGNLLGNYPEFTRFFSAKLTGLFPAAAQEIAQDIGRLISHRGLGWVSVLLYGLLSYQVFASVEKSLNVVFKVRQGRHMFVSVILSIVAVTVIIALVALSFAATSAMQFVKAYGPEIPGIKIGKLTQFVVRYVLPFALVFASASLMYVIGPKTRVRMAHALQGALFTAALLEVAKHIFTWYVSSVASFGRIYGPLTAFVMFLLWMFYSSSIFLVGAEIVHNLGDRKSR